MPLWYDKGWYAEDGDSVGVLRVDLLARNLLVHAAHAVGLFRASQLDVQKNFKASCEVYDN